MRKETEATLISSTVAPFPATSARPLYVDMDGTLLATDVLWETLIVLLKTKPALLLHLPLWLLKGKAFLKRQLASHISVNPVVLPYHEPVVAFLNRERQKGREIVLATASDLHVARIVARYLGLFSTVLASDGSTNLAAHAKLSAIVQHADGAAFDYVGNSSADLTIWKQAAHAILVQPSRRLLKKASRVSAIEDVLCPRRPFLGDFLRMLRLHQWPKNVLLLVPLLLAHKAAEPQRILHTLLGFVAFGLAASAVYIVNDLLDLESDRQHPNKRLRPLAAGLVPISVAGVTALLSAALSAGISATLLPGLFSGMLLLYLGTTMAYSLVFKRVAILDVVVLASLYTIRVLAGAIAGGVPASQWFLAFSMFLFLSLAFVKRYAELRLAEDNGGANGFLAARAYQPTDLDLLRSVGAASGYAAVLVLALYINSPEVHILYRKPAVLWLIGPLLLYWVTRVWFLAHRGRMHDDPVVFAFTDRPSYVLAGLIAILLVVASVM